MKKLILCLALAASLTVSAQTTPVLVIGVGTQVPLRDIVSIHLDDSSLTLLKADGTQVVEPLATLTFSSVAGIRDIMATQPDAAYAVYDLSGRLVKRGKAQQGTAGMLTGLAAGTYVIRIGDQSVKVCLDAPASADITLPGVSNSQTLDGPSAMLTDSGLPVLAASAKGTAMQIAMPGIDPMPDVAVIDSLTFADDLTALCVHHDGTVASYAIDDIAQITFTESQSEVSIVYDGESTDGVNPLCYDGVSIITDGAGVTVTSTYSDEVEYQLSGTSPNGYFKIYSAVKWQATLLGLTLCNPVGPVINSQTGKKGTIKMQNGYENHLSDGATYADSDEDQKGCIFSEGQLIFKGKGTLYVSGNATDRHAICSDDYLSFENGQVTVLCAQKDALHGKDSVMVQSGTVTLSANSDGIDSDGPITVREGDNGAPVLSITTTYKGSKGIKTATDFLMTAGSVTITQTGANTPTDDDDPGKVIGIKADGNIIIQGGTVVINNTADGGTALSADGNITISDAASVTDGSHTAVTLTMTGAGGKGINADGTFTLGDSALTTSCPVITIATTGARYNESSSTTTGGGGGFSFGGGWPGGGGGGNKGGGGNNGGQTSSSSGSSAKAIKAQGHIDIYGGQTTITTAADGAEGIESKTSISIHGGVHYLKCYDDCINSSGIIAFSGGNIVCWSTGNDAVDSNYGKTGAITISGGNIFSYTTKGGVEEGFDCDNNSYITITGGIAISAGGSQGGGSTSSASKATTQAYYLGTTSMSYATSTYYTLCSTSGQTLCTYCFGQSCSSNLSLLTAPDLGKGSITIKSGSVKPSECTLSVNDVFFIAPSVSTTKTFKTLTSK